MMDVLQKDEDAPQGQTRPTMDVLLKDENAPDGQTRPKVDVLLKDESTPDSHSYIWSLLWQFSLYGDTPENWKSPWWIW